MRKELFINVGKKFPILVLIVLLSSCSRTTIITYNIPLYEYPADWKDLTVREKTISDYSKYISGIKIFLDPGHGGEDRKNKNKKGDIIEADVNLRVALYLKKYLEAAGTRVFISRMKDTTIALADRSTLADNSGAGIFVSIHHNAPAKTEDDYTNYTAAYYHAKEENFEFEPCNHDIAKYIERDLSYVMRNPIGLGSFDGTYSDYSIYPGEGFSVLRKTNIPAVLIECAFHTNHLEEMRLNNDEFNQIQAWGIFRGLAKYFKAGKPEINFIYDSLRVGVNTLKASFTLKDSIGINPKSIQVFINKEEKGFIFDSASGILSVNINDIKPGEYIVRVIAANKNGNHSFPYYKKIIVNSSLSPVVE